MIKEKLKETTSKPNVKFKRSLTLLVTGFMGTIVGALFNEYFTFSNLGAAIVFYPFSLIIQILGCLMSLSPSIGFSIWSTSILNSIDVISFLALILFSILYFKKKTKMMLVICGISFFVLNLGNMNQFTAMMSV